MIAEFALATQHPSFLRVLSGVCHFCPHPFLVYLDCSNPFPNLGAGLSWLGSPYSALGAGLRA